MVRVTVQTAPRVGILGGTFDPLHIGHLVLADCAIETLDLDVLLFVPAADPPHKPAETRASVDARLAMLECALSLDLRFTLSRVDVDRPGPHYTVDTVRIVQQQYPGSELYFLMGGDSFRDLPGWHQPEILIQLCMLAVMPRPGVELMPTMHNGILQGLPERVVMIDAPLIEISSTEIVERLQAGKSVRYLVPEVVLAYIADHHVYQG